MPSYTWFDKRGSKEITVLRRLSEYELPPMQYEIEMEWKDPAERPVDPEWERQVGSKNQSVRTFNMKGYW